MASLSREIAKWVANLEYDALPDAVVDRAKGLTLQGLSSALLGYGTDSGQAALNLMKAEEGSASGVATVLVSGDRLTRGGAAFVNAEMIFAGGKWDTFKMLTHPGCSILPAAFAAAQQAQASGKDFLVGIVAAYEVMERMASAFIPSVMARGFHASPVFGIFGAALAAAKILRLSEDQINGTIAQCANLAAGNLEGGRSGGMLLREGGAVRNAMLAVALGRQGMVGGETVLEGEAGFYHAYTGNNQGKLSYVFEGPMETSLNEIIEGLGQDWTLLETLYRIYSTSGYNIAHIDVTAALCREHDIKAEDVERVEAVVNWMETLYPSPAFPRPGVGEARPGSTQYFSAYAVVNRGFPLLRTGPDASDPPLVLDLMKRVTLIPSKTQGLFAPSITIYMRDGKQYHRDATGREFIWDFDEEVRRISGIVPGIPIPEAQFQEIIDSCRRLDQIGQAEELIALTLANR